MKALIFDIEGTTTDINFVHNILFPFAKKNIESFVRSEQENLAPLIQKIKADNNISSIDEVIALLKKWIDEDKKVKELKDIQGLIWKEGYQKGEYTAHLYPDVIPALNKWKDQGLDLYIYSSGSIQAQKLLFSHTESGDITSLFKGYFDTTSGPKKESQSYKTIASDIDVSPQMITFFTDSPDEAKAASEAELNVIHVNRDGLYDDSKFKMIKSFDKAEVTHE